LSELLREADTIKRHNNHPSTSKRQRSIMEPFSLKATVVATIFASLLAGRAYKRKSLTPSGSVAAFAVGFLLIVVGLRGFNLLVFYFIATTATKYKKDIKAKIDGTIVSNKGSTTRSVTQVLACSLLATMLALVHAYKCGSEQSIQFISTSSTHKLASQLSCGIIAHHATCLADTLASELGILSKTKPVLITQPWKTVPSGTNGGITPIGLFWSSLGGALIGASTIILDTMSGISYPTEKMLQMVLFGLCCGLVGSIIDSLLGATLQQSYYDEDTKLVYQEEDDKPKSAKLVTGHNLLTNELVNVVSVAITTIVGGWIVGPLIFSS
jgi:uncharacterized protein (TIGR00297 family)